MTRLLLPTAVAFALLAPSAGAQRYVAFGDSITLGVLDDPGRGGYPARLDATLDAAGQSATVENRGKDGETTAEGLSRINTLTGAAGDWLLIMEGTNDIAQGISVETAAANLRSMVNRGRQRGFGQVHLATLVPRGVGAPAAQRLGTIALADEIRQDAYELNAPQPDPNMEFGETPDFRTALFVDSIHPNARGYDVLAEAFANQILNRDRLAPVPAFVSPPNESVDVQSTAQLEVVLFDAQSGIDLAAAPTLTVNGTAVATEVSGDNRRAVLRARPGNLTGRPLLGVDALDRATPANRRRLDVSQFTVRGTAFLAGDIDRSGRVDGTDLVTLARAFGTRSGDARYIAAADLDGNARVDGNDLAQLAANFGVSSF